MANEMVLATAFENLPATQIGSDSDFESIATASEFLPRLQLFTKGKAVNRKLIPLGNWGIPVSEDEVTDLGETVDLILLARRPKALDMSDRENPITVYDVRSDEFKRIQKQSEVKVDGGSGCMYGPSFLVFERTTGKFLEYFCYNASARQEADKMFKYLPLTQAQIDAKKAVNPAADEETPHGPIPVTLGAKLIEKKTYSWHAPVAMKCSTPFNRLPTQEKLVEQVNKFLAVKSEGAAVVPETGEATNTRVR